MPAPAADENRPCLAAVSFRNAKGMHALVGADNNRPRRQRLLGSIGTAFKELTADHDGDRPTRVTVEFLNLAFWRPAMEQHIERPPPGQEFTGDILAPRLVRPQKFEAGEIELTPVLVPMPRGYTHTARSPAPGPNDEAADELSHANLPLV